MFLETLIIFGVPLLIVGSFFACSISYFCRKKSVIKLCAMLILLILIGFMISGIRHSLWLYDFVMM